MAKVLIGNFKGPKGDKGDKGDVGTAATIQVGTTQTVQPEENAEVTNTGTTTAAVLNFKIPRGEDGMTDLTAEYKDASEYTCQPTVNAPVVVKKLDGKTEQVVTTGRQLINTQLFNATVNGITAKSNPDGSVTVSGTSTGAFNADISLRNLGLKAGTYYVQADSNDENILVRIAFNSGSGYQYVYSGNSIELNDFNTYSGIAFQIVVDPIGVTVNEVIHPMLSLGSTALPWEPYTGGAPSPSPEYPQDITGVGGKAGGSDFSTVVETQGRNLFDASKITTTSAGGATVTNNGDGSFTISGSGDLTTSFTTRYVLTYEDMQELLSGNNIVKIDGASGTVPTFMLAIQSSISVVNTIISGQSKDISEYLNSNYSFIFQFYAASGEAIVPGTIRPMLYQSGDSTYQPYHHTTLPIPLTAPLYDGDKICYVKPGESYVNADGETVTAGSILYGCYRENASVVFDGSSDENWNKSAGDLNQNDRFYIIVSKAPYITDLNKSNMLVWKTYATEDNSFYIDNNKALFIRILNITDVNALKTWLSTNPLTVVYRLAQPYFEPFADQSIFYDLRTDDTLTYIYSSDPIEPNITVDVAKNETGGILLESYATAQKNSLAEADNASRLAEVEQQLVTLNTTVSTMGGQ